MKKRFFDAYGIRPWALIASVALTFVLFVSVVIGAGAIAVRTSERTETITVRDKFTTDVFRIATTDNRAFSVEGSIAFSVFDATERYAALQVGHTYRCRVAGWRIGWLEMYPNLLACEEAK